MEHRGTFDYSLELVHSRTLEAERQVTVIFKDSEDHDGLGMAFEVRYLGTLKEPFDHFKAVCCKTCKPTRDLRFKQDGITVLATETPRKLKLLHNSVTIIRVYSNVSGLNCTSCKATGYPKSAGIIKPGTPVPSAALMQSLNKARDPITLVVEDQTGFRMSVKTYAASALSSVMDAYAAHVLRDRSVLRFFVDGEKLSSKDTAKQYSMANNDIIQVFIEQKGG
ncbi:SUMO protein smt3 [Elasticomyces elasticus]|nr:SUMO protein smt3 [Elasticomyces elasticus]KAK3663127.1 SUMO protein smt3 [Elasticomyces elasticus]KAK4924023.1 SUMO protein smt3 [Elasticomyces elasticus]KAK5764380.1 SUMO protein smt3 [Elasticomyces elasticus]